MSPERLEITTIPPYFRCPISLNLMSDPVSLSTGVTYDRASIERWLEAGNNTCPATMQVLKRHDLTPNHTLRRLIQEWCVRNRSRGVERIPTPKQPAEPVQVQHMLEDITNGVMREDTLQRLRCLTMESEKNRLCVSKAGAVPVLAAVLGSHNCLEIEVREVENARESAGACEEALGTLALVSLNEKTAKMLAGPKQLAAICWFLSRGTPDARINAAILLGSMAVEHDELKSTIASLDGAMDGLIDLLKQGKFNPRGVLASLKCFEAIFSLRRTRVKAVEAGMVALIVDLLVEDADRQILELAVSVIDLLCTCAEARAAVCDHALAIPALVKIMLRKSDLATEHALAALWAICRSAPDVEIHLRAVQAGMYTKLLVLIQSDYSPRSKGKASDLLKILQNTWRENPYHSADGLVVMPL